MTKLAQSALLAVMFALALASAAAQTLTGTVTNGTTGKPAVGDEVIIINLANGMDVGGTTKADSAGKFSFKITVPGPHLIRAVHQGVNYHQMAPPGVNTADVQVYDVATKVTDLSVTADVIRFQADSGTMQGIRLFVVNNTSSPPKTQMNDHNFEFYLPAGAKVEQVQARAPNGQPISADAVPDPEKTSDKNRYAINFPLRPGETQFQVEFTLPYSGEIKIDPKPLYSAQHLVVVLPKTMQFKAANPSSYQSMPDPTQADSNVEVAQQTKPGQPLGFTLKGTGVITESPGETASGAAQQQESHRDATIVLATIVLTTIGRAADSAFLSTLPMLCRSIAGPSSSDSPCCSPLEDGWSRNGKPEHRLQRHPLRSRAGRRALIAQPSVQPPRPQYPRPALRPQNRRCCSKR